MSLRVGLIPVLWVRLRHRVVQLTLLLSSLSVCGWRRCAILRFLTSPNTGVLPALLQRGGKDWMLEYTRKIITINTDGKTIQD